ncbi:DUF397 domain-containing protein [Streptomyces jumonjinensis]|uniref:DUF397 domain-containing protein n=1 Tax=Streptomyces jumonjinensis TaxID=1945 RepID=A0A646KTI7_STRJU|nr:DUF397 domain-containing protein [Streptomyces jumonjinensis]MQT05410.1 DUF397 domain-containing protein [Streptomyces jumonjinensis]
MTSNTETPHAPLTDCRTGLAWFKSSYSTQDNGNCIEVADVRAHGGIAIRDSKNPTGPMLMVSPDAFTRFIDARSEPNGI